MTTDTTALPSIDPAALLDLLVRSEMTANELRVAALLVQHASLIDNEPNFQLARWEIAEAAGLSTSTTQRALGSLSEKGLIGRSQDAATKGEIAITTVTDRLLGLFGLTGGIQAPVGVPVELLNLLVREKVEVANAITQAWQTATYPAPRVVSEFQGGSSRWRQVEFLLLGRVESETMKMVADHEAREEADTTVSLPDGSKIQVCQEAFRNLAPEKDTAMAGADLRFAVHVLNLVGKRAPELLRTRAIEALMAEALYSRQKGFVWRHDFSDATRIVASVMVRGSWSAPRGIDSTWYDTVRGSMRFIHRVSGSASLN